MRLPPTGSVHTQILTVFRRNYKTAGIAPLTHYAINPNAKVTSNA